MRRRRTPRRRHVLNKIDVNLLLCFLLIWSYCSSNHACGSWSLCNVLKPPRRHWFPHNLKIKCTPLLSHRPLQLNQGLHSAPQQAKIHTPQNVVQIYTEEVCKMFITSNPTSSFFGRVGISSLESRFDIFSCSNNIILGRGVRGHACGYRLHWLSR